jgi:hypothetical protein
MEHRNRRYTWRNSKTDSEPGQAGEIPIIRIFDDEPIPPIGKCCAISINWILEQISGSLVTITWEVEESLKYHNGVLLRCQLRLNDPRLMEQYKLDSEMANKIFGWISQEKIKRFYDERYYNLTQKIFLSKLEIPDRLLGFVNKVEEWRNFLYVKQSYEFRFGATISKDGYYELGVTSANILVPTDKESYENDPGFRFDKDSLPPQINDDIIFWGFPDSKIRVYLPHNRSNISIASYYGYYDIWLQAIQKNKEKRDGQTAEVRELMDADDNKKQELVHQLQQELLPTSGQEESRGGDQVESE